MDQQGREQSGHRRDGRLADDCDRSPPHRDYHQPLRQRPEQQPCERDAGRGDAAPQRKLRLDRARQCHRCSADGRGEAGDPAGRCACYRPCQQRHRCLHCGSTEREPAMTAEMILHSYPDGRSGEENLLPRRGIIAVEINAGQRESVTNCSVRAWLAPARRRWIRDPECAGRKRSRCRLLRDVAAGARQRDPASRAAGMDLDVWDFRDRALVRRPIARACAQGPRGPESRLRAKGGSADDRVRRPAPSRAMASIATTVEPSAWRLPAELFA